MKILLLALYFFNFQVSFDEVDKLVEEKQYVSAVELLNKLDPEDDNPEAIRRKLDIFLEYYVLTIAHQMFALKNLEEGENITDLRGKNGGYPMYSLNIKKIEEVMKKNPSNYELKLSVGNYYHSMHLNCGDCTISESDCIERFQTLFKECYDNGVYNYFSAYGLAYASLRNEAYKESIPYFLKSIELKEDYPSSHYNLSYAYLYLNDHNNCIEYGKKALEYYDYPPYKADAAKIIATAYNELKEFKMAYTYFKQAYKINSEDYYILKPFLELCIYLKKEEEHQIRNSFFLLDTDNPTIYQDLVSLYYKYEKIEDLLQYFESVKSDYKEDYATLGSLHFFTGSIIAQNGELQKGKESLLLAKETLLKVYEPNHQVFGIIEDFLKQN